MFPGTRRFGMAHLRSRESIEEWEDRRRQEESVVKPPKAAGAATVFDEARDLGAFIQEYGPEAAPALIERVRFEQRGGVAGELARLTPEQRKAARIAGRRLKYESRTRADQIVSRGFKESQPGQTSKALSAVLGEPVEELKAGIAKPELAGGVATGEERPFRRFRVGDQVMTEQGVRNAVERKLMERGRAMGGISGEAYAVATGAPGLPAIAPKPQPPPPRPSGTLPKGVAWTLDPETNRWETLDLREQLGVEGERTNVVRSVPGGYDIIQFDSKGKHVETKQVRQPPLPVQTNVERKPNGETVTVKRVRMPDTREWVDISTLVVGPEPIRATLNGKPVEYDRMTDTWTDVLKTPPEGEAGEMKVQGWPAQGEVLPSLVSVTEPLVSGGKVLYDLPDEMGDMDPAKRHRSALLDKKTRSMSIVPWPGEVRKAEAIAARFDELAKEETADPGLQARYQGQAEAWKSYAQEVAAATGETLAGESEAAAKAQESKLQQEQVNTTYDALRQERPDLDPKSEEFEAVLEKRLRILGG